MMWVTLITTLAPKLSWVLRWVVRRLYEPDCREQYPPLRPWRAIASRASADRPRRFPVSSAESPDFPACAFRNCADATKGGKFRDFRLPSEFHSRCGEGAPTQNSFAMANTVARTYSIEHRKARLAAIPHPNAQTSVRTTIRNRPEGAERERPAFPGFAGAGDTSSEAHFHGRRRFLLVS